MPGLIASFAIHIGRKRLNFQRLSDERLTVAPRAGLAHRVETGFHVRRPDGTAAECGCRRYAAHRVVWLGREVPQNGSR